MTSIVLLEPTALRIFPDRQCAESWPDAVADDYDPSCCRFPKSCSVREPSVKWLVVNEPLVCGRLAYHKYTSTCPDCSGTGRPTVEVRSAVHQVGYSWFEKIHGTVEIGPAILIGDDDTTGDGFLYAGPDQGPGFIIVGGGLTQPTIHRSEFGDQNVTPGRFAHPITKATPA